MIAAENDVFYCAVDERRQIDAIGNVDVARYRKSLQERGVNIVDDGVGKALDTRQYAASCSSGISPRCG